MSRYVPAALLGVLVLLALTARTSGEEPPESAARPPAANQRSLPPSPAKIGRLRRNSDGSIILIGPIEPAPPTDPVPPDLHPDGVMPLAPANPPAALSPIPPSESQPRSRPDAVTPLFDPQFLQSIQDRTPHEQAAARHQQEIDRILREESRAKTLGTAVDARGLTRREIVLEQQLKRIDREIREHEMDHFRAGLPYGSLPEYWEVTGPLGKRYAVTGITRFDMSWIGDDRDKTLQKFEILRRAALAPRVPSDVDRRIAGELTRLIAILQSRR